MMRLYYILLFLSVFLNLGIFAQNKSNGNIGEETLSMQKDTILLNEETLKAIREGTLIHMEGQPLNLSSPELPILRDFSDYLKADTTKKALLIDSLPPAIFVLYPMDTTGHHIRGVVYKPMNSLVVKDRIRLGKTTFYVQGGTQNLFLEEVKDGQRRGSVGISVKKEFSLENTLRYIFWKSERDKRRNRKREFTWKHYNSYP